MANSPNTTTAGSTSGLPEVVFGHTADGMLAARVADNAFAMAPGRDGCHYLVTAWRINRPISQWKRADFYGHSGALADEAAFRARVLENAEHQREQRAFGRREIQSTAYTPWGPSQGATVYAEGITCHSFLAEHADDWLVQSAILSDQHPGFTEVIATKGGRREHGVERRRFLIPSPEYRMGRFGFVVDTQRYAEYTDVSSFPGIQGKRVA